MEWCTFGFRIDRFGVAGTMTWNGIHPLVHLLTRVYQKGKKLTKKEMRAYEKKLKRAEKLPKWDMTILLQPG